MATKNLVVQLWGIGNLVQAEPLMRYLKLGDILVDPKRSTDQMAPLFPDWKFLQSLDPESRYDDVYLCGPWIRPADFGGNAKRVHTPTWTFQGQWQTSESRVLLDMVVHGEYLASGSSPRLPCLLDWSKANSNPYVVVSCGYNRHEPGWDFKDWGKENFTQALKKLNAQGVEGLLVGSSEEWEDFWPEKHEGRMVWREPFIDQIKMASSCLGYLGNDTGWAHICGAYGLPSAVYVADPTRQDPVKNRPAAPTLWQFTDKVSPEQVADWLSRNLLTSGA